MRAADVDGDGWLDAITANRDSDNISVLINNRNGTFAAAVSYTAADGPRGMDVGDLDGDGYPDVVTANRDAGNVTVLLNDGGKFVSHPKDLPTIPLRHPAPAATDPYGWYLSANEVALVYPLNLEAASWHYAPD